MTLDFKETGHPPTVASPVGQYPGTCSGDSVAKLPTLQIIFRSDGVCGQLIITLGLQKDSQMKVKMPLCVTVLLNNSCSLRMIRVSNTKSYDFD